MGSENIISLANIYFLHENVKIMNENKMLHPLKHELRIAFWGIWSDFGTSSFANNCARMFQGWK